MTFSPHTSSSLERLRALARSALGRHAMSLVAVALLLIAMGGSWMFASDAVAAPNATASSSATTTKSSTQPPQDVDPYAPRPAKKEVTGKLNLNTATEEQLVLLPTVGPAKAERVVTWRKKNGGFKRTADLRRVKGFGYKTFKRLEPYLDIKGESTLAAKR